jgi:mRNA-degrading endonuclease toxin of MazEF toxin-antitoxin module
MAFQRGDIIELTFLIPGKNKTEQHPAVIISNDDVYNNEGIYICVMITHSGLNESFAFNLTPDMFLNPDNAPEGKAKAHLLAYVLENQIINNRSSKKTRMKKVYVDKLVDFINDTVLLED